MGTPSESVVDYFYIPASPAPRAPVPYPVGTEAALAVVAAAAAEALGVTAEDLGTHLGDLGDVTGSSLDDFGEAGSQLAHALTETASGDLTGLADLVGDELASDLGSAASVYFDGAVPHLADRLSGLADVIDAGSGVMDLAAALAPPVEWARGIVETIGNMLEAMALGL